MCVCVKGKENFTYEGNHLNKWLCKGSGTDAGGMGKILYRKERVAVGKQGNCSMHGG